MDTYEKALEPFTKGRSVDWEVQIEECDVGLFVAFLPHLTSDYLQNRHTANTVERERYKPAVTKHGRRE